MLGQIFNMFSNVGHLYIRASEGQLGRRDDIDSTEWLAFVHLLTTVETLHVSGRLAGQIARARRHPSGDVTEVLPSLHLPLFDDDDRQVESTEQFVSLCQLYGRPVTIVDLETKRLESIYAYRRS